MKLNISRYEVQNKRNFNKKIYEEKDTLYKICSDYNNYETQDILTYINSIPKIEGVLGINDLLCENGFIYGYTMPKLNDSVTLKSIIENHFTNEEKYYLIKRLTDILKQLHNYLVVGDIRLDNILIYNNEPIFIDLENGQKIYERNYLITLYDLRDKPYSVIDDLFKLFICVISIIYNRDFEYLFEFDVTKRGIFDKFISEIPSNEIKTYYEYLKESLIEDNIHPIYFTDIFQNFNEDTIKNIVEKPLSLKLF